MKKIFLDYETRSAFDLKRGGSWLYAHHPSTQILCAAYAIDDGPVELWRLGEKLPGFLANAVDSGALVVGHNFAGFDSYLWETVWKFPPIPPYQICDTLALAYAMALPGSLDGAATAMGLKHQKDMKAHRVMMQLSQPRSEDPLVWWTPEDVPEKFEMLYAYAKKDIEATRELYDRLMKLSPQEKKIWALDYKINRRGVRVDLPNVHRAIKVVEREQERLNQEMRKVTEGAVASAQAVSQITDYLKFKLNMAKKPTVDKQSVAAALAGQALPPDVRRVLEIRQEAAKSSTAKLKAMDEAADPLDQRVRNCFAYHGANTGRWCLSEGSLVLVKRDGIVDKVAIEEVQLTDLVWDGDNWVHHEGVVFSGEKECIEWDGVLATSEHRVYTSANESTPLSEAKETKTRLYQGSLPDLWDSIP